VAGRGPHPTESYGNYRSGIRAADPRNRTKVMRNPVIMRNPRCEMAAALPGAGPRGSATDTANVGD